MPKKNLKLILAPNAFKNSLSAVEVCKAMKEGALQANADLDIHEFPLADGGDGSLEVLQKYNGCKIVTLDTENARSEAITATVGLGENKGPGIVELAQASGFRTLDHSHPYQASTYGSGVLARQLIEMGMKEIIVCLGGSVTHDLGLGFLQALGLKVFIGEKEIERVTGKDLNRIDRIIETESFQRIKSQVKFRVLCDVKNPLTGKNGAAMVYSGQKGATAQEVEQLERGSKQIAKLIKQQNSEFDEKGVFMGSAGGTSAGLSGLLDARCELGADYIIFKSGLENHLENADLIITGEGKADNQSIKGKVAGSLIQLTKKYNLPIAMVAGKIELAFENSPFLFTKSLIDDQIDEKMAMKRAYNLIAKRTLGMINQM